MLSKKMQDAINQQINAEFYSAYLYLAMAAYFEDTNLDGFANWMHIQFQEEQAHAMKFYNFVNERGGRVKLDAIEAPPKKWDSPLAAFQATLEHEQKVTGLINNLVKIAREENDNATEFFLQWFVTEQVEEEKNASDLVGKLKLFKDSPQALFMLDQQLAQRVFTPPTPSDQ